MLLENRFRLWLQRQVFTHRGRLRRRGIWQASVVQALEVRTLLTVSILNNGGQGVAGLNFGQSGGYVPPDTNGAAGPTGYVETVNQAVALYPSKGTTAGALTDTLSHFFFTAGKLTRADSGSSLSDPIVTYDEKIGRFIIGDQDVNFTTHVSAFDLAVSKTSNPTTLTAADWTFYKINTTQTNEDADYPGNFGYNADAFVFTLNMFPVSGTTGTYHTLVVSVNASDLASAAAIPQVAMNNLVDFNLRPTTMHDSVPGDPMWLVTDHGDGLSIDVYKMTNVLSNTAAFTRTNLAVQSYQQAAPPKNPNGTVITSNIDSRIMKAAEANQTLVATHTVAVSSTQDVAQWYAIDVSSGTPVLSQQGRVGAGNNTYVYYPGIDINPSGSIGMSYIRSGTDTSTDYMSMWVTGRTTSDLAGTMQTPVLVPSGTGLANYTDFANPHRAGDLSGINVDPVDGTFWAANEFATAQASSNWGTAIANFSPSAGNRLVIVQAPPLTATAGVALDPAIVINLVGPTGSLLTGDNSNVTLTLNGGMFADGSSSITVQAVGGVASFSGLTINKAGSYSLTAVDGLFSPATTSAFTITPAAASQLLFQSVPATGTAGVTLSPSVKVAVADQFGNTVTTDNSTVTLGVASGPGTFTGASTLGVAAVNGVATFSNLKLNTAGAYSLTAADGTLSSPTSGTLTISPAAASQLAFLPASATTGTAGVALTPALVVAVEDQFGNVVTTGSSTVTLTLNTGTFSTGSKTASATTSSGLATFSTLTINLANSYTLNATSGSLTGAAWGVTITPAAAAKLALQQAPPASVTAGVTFSPAVRVAVQDKFGNVVSSDSSNVALTLNTGTFSTASKTATAQAVNGVATFSTLAINKTGTYKVTASDGTLTTIASGNISVVPGAASQLLFQTVPTTGTAGVVLATAVKVVVTDALGNVVTSDTSTVNLSIASGPGTFTAGSTLSVAAVSGVATFNNLALNTAGKYTLGASDGTLTAATSGTLTINASTATQLVLLQTPAAAATAGVALSPAAKVAVEDKFGNLVTAATPVTLTLSSGKFSTGSATITANTSGGIATFSTLTINTAGSYTISASSGAMAAVSFGVTVSPAAASKLGYLQAPPSSITAGVTFSPDVTVAIQDKFGNTITGNTSTVTLTLNTGTFANGAKTATAQAALGVATFSGLTINKSGTYKLTATDGTLTSIASGNIVVGAAAATKLVIQAAPSSGTAGTALAAALKVAVADVYGNVVTGDNSTVSLNIATGPAAFDAASTVSTPAVNGVATFTNLILDTAGKYTLQATDGSLTSVTSGTITINAAAASKLVIQQAPTTGTAGVNLSPAAKVAVTDAFGNIITAAATITLTLDSGTFANGATSVSAATSAGVATFSTLNIKAAGNYTLTATSGTLNSAALGVTINPAAASKVVFLQGPPASGIAGQALSPAVTVAIEDALGNIETADNTSTVTLTLSAGTFADGSTTQTVTVSGGIATFDSLVVNTPGTYTLAASSSSLAAATSTSFTIFSSVAEQLLLSKVGDEGVELPLGPEEIAEEADDFEEIASAYLEGQSSPLIDHAGIVTLYDLEDEIAEMLVDIDADYLRSQLLVVGQHLTAEFPPSERLRNVLNLIDSIGTV